MLSRSYGSDRLIKEPGSFPGVGQSDHEPATAATWDEGVPNAAVKIEAPASAKGNFLMIKMVAAVSSLAITVERLSHAADVHQILFGWLDFNRSEGEAAHRSVINE